MATPTLPDTETPERRPISEYILCSQGPPGHETPATLVVEYNVALPPYCGDFDTRFLLTCDALACIFEATVHAEAVGCHHDLYPLTVADAEAITGLEVAS